MKPSLLERIVHDPKALTVRFQPIFDLGTGVSHVDSLEALVRGPEGTNFERADILFDYVRRKHAEAAVDRSCIAAICKVIAELPAHCRININVHALTLGQNPDFVDFFRHQTRVLSLPPERITLEVVEHAPGHDVPALTCTIRALRDLGVRIALDDVGLGNSNYRMILDVRPDYFKLDAFFVQGVSFDPDRRAVVKSIMCLAHELKGVVVAEGVQTSEDLWTLTQMGIKLFQANLLSPAMLPQELVAKGLIGEHSVSPAGEIVSQAGQPVLLSSAVRSVTCQ